MQNQKSSWTFILEITMKIYCHNAKHEIVIHIEARSREIQFHIINLPQCR